MDLKNLIVSHKKVFTFLIIACLSIISLFYILFNLNPDLKVVGSIPKPDGFLDIKQPYITVVFETNISSNTQKQISVKIEPQLDHRLVWDKPSELSIILSDPKLTEETVLISTVYKNKTIYTLPIKIVLSLYSTQQLNEQARLQGIKDLEFGETIKQVYKELPFLTKLPISNDKYTIVYDFDKKTIRVRLYTDRSLVEKEINNLLKSIGVDIKKYPPYYLP